MVCVLVVCVAGVRSGALATGRGSGNRHLRRVCGERKVVGCYTYCRMKGVGGCGGSGRCMV